MEVYVRHYTSQHAYLLIIVASQRSPYLPIIKAKKAISPTNDNDRLQGSATYRLKVWRNEQRSDTLKYLDSEDQSLWKITKWVMRVPTPSHHHHHQQQQKTGCGQGL
jgi:hypothetical protein